MKRGPVVRFQSVMHHSVESRDHDITVRNILTPILMHHGYIAISSQISCDRTYIAYQDRIQIVLTFLFLYLWFL